MSHQSSFQLVLPPREQQWWLIYICTPLFSAGHVWCQGFLSCALSSWSLLPSALLRVGTSWARQMISVTLTTHGVRTGRTHNFYLIPFLVELLRPFEACTWTKCCQWGLPRAPQRLHPWQFHFPLLLGLGRGGGHAFLFSFLLMADSNWCVLGIQSAEPASNGSIC